MFFVLQSEASSTECGLEMFCSIDREHGIVEVMYLGEFLLKPFCQHSHSGRMQPDMGNFVRFWINSGVQPVAIFGKLNHRLVECDVIQCCVNNGL